MLKWPLTALACVLCIAFAQAQVPVRKMRPDGPNAQALGQSQGYPSCIAALQQPSCRVGTCLLYTSDAADE